MTPQLAQIYDYRDMLKAQGIPTAMLGAHSKRQRIWLLLQIAVDSLAQATRRPHSCVAYAVLARMCKFLRGAKARRCMAGEDTLEALLAPLMSQGEVVMRCPKCGQGFTEEALGLGVDGVAGSARGSKSPRKPPRSR